MFRPILAAVKSPPTLLRWGADYSLSLAGRASAAAPSGTVTAVLGAALRLSLRGGLRRLRRTALSPLAGGSAASGLPVCGGFLLRCQIPADLDADPLHLDHLALDAAWTALAALAALLTGRALAAPAAALPLTALALGLLFALGGV